MKLGPREQLTLDAGDVAAVRVLNLTGKNLVCELERAPGPLLTLEVFGVADVNVDDESAASDPGDPPGPPGWGPDGEHPLPGTPEGERVD